MSRLSFTSKCAHLRPPKNAIRLEVQLGGLNCIISPQNLLTCNTRASLLPPTHKNQHAPLFHALVGMAHEHDWHLRQQPCFLHAWCEAAHGPFVGPDGVGELQGRYLLDHQVQRPKTEKLTSKKYNTVFGRHSIMRADVKITQWFTVPVDLCAVRTSTE